MKDVEFEKLIEDKHLTAIGLFPIIAYHCYAVYKKKKIEAMKVLLKNRVVIGRKYHYIDLSNIKIINNDISESISFLLKYGIYEDNEIIYSKFLGEK